MSLPKRSELKDFDINRDITVCRNNDGSFCALFGKDIHLGVGGLGETEQAAVKALNEQKGFTRYSDAKIFKVSEND